MALAKMGAFEILLKHSDPSSSIEHLKRLVDELDNKMKDEDGNINTVDVYIGVDREIFDGSFAMTTEAERQQAITGETWNLGSANAESKLFYAASIALGLVDLMAWGGFAIATINPGANILPFYSIGQTIDTVIKYGADGKYLGMTSVKPYWSWHAQGVWFWSAIGIALIAAGLSGISTWYNYYNPDYTEIPNVLVDVYETDLGDKYVKYNAAKVYGEDDMNADFNAYEGKEWIALYYTKDANAGNSLTPNFKFNENDSTIARRYQGVAMFGETKAFNLNSHVYNSDAKGAYLTVRYSNTKKAAAADIPNVVGSIFAKSALYTVTVLVGVSIGASAVILVQNQKKRREDLADDSISADSNETT
jgi:hypothetical protein